MNGIELLTGPLAQAIVQALGWALVHLLWQGAIIAAILAAVLALMENRGANARYVVCCAALTLLLVCGIATAYRSYEAPLTIDATTAPLAKTAVDPNEAPLASADPSSLVATMVASNGVEPATLLAAVRTLLPQVVLLWLGGVILLSLRLVTNWMRAVRMAQRDVVEMDGRWQQIAARLASALALRRAIRLVESAAVEVPTVIGFVRPVILLPLSTLTGLSTDQIEMVLAHELAHIRRHDFFVNLLQAVVETLLFYHPAVWWMSRRVRIERENCCDDLAVAVCGNALQYARALTRLEELRADGVQSVVAANGGSLIARIRRIVGTRGDAAGSSTSRWIAGAAVLITLTVLLAIPSMPLLASHEAQAPTPAPTAQPAAAQVEVQASATPVAAEADEADHDDSVDVESDETPEAQVTPETPSAPEPDFMPEPPITPPVPNVAPTPHAAPAPRIAPMASVAPMALARAAAIVDLSQDIADQAVAEAHIGEDSHRSHHIGESGKLSVDDLITLRNMGVTPEYVQQMRAALGQGSLDDIMAMRVQGITPEYVSQIRAIGFGNLSTNDIVTMRVQGVTPDYVKQMRAVFGDLPLKEIVAMRVQGINPDYVKRMRDAGIELRSARDAISLRVQGVTPEFVKSLKEAGYTNLSARDLVRLAASGVNVEFIREMSKYHNNK